MLHRRLLMVMAGALVTALSPLGVRPAQGQSAGGYYYETYRYGYNPGYYAHHYPVLPVFVVPSKMAPSRMPYVYYVPASAVTPPRGNRTPLGGVRILFGVVTQAPADVPAQIELQVPVDAQVWFDNEKTTQTGVLRHFVSPPLTSGKAYIYEIRATWKECEREVTESRRLSIRAGDRLSASFPTASVNLAAGKNVSTSP